MDLVCRSCHRLLGKLPPSSRGAGPATLCRACHECRRWNLAAQRRTVARLRTDAWFRRERSADRIRLTRATVDRGWRGLLAAWQACAGSGMDAGEAAWRRRHVPPPAAPPARAELRILLVEDDPWLRDATRLLLEDLGHDVRVAADGAEALRLLRAERPDVVLCDLRMPRMDGVAFVRAVRRDLDWSHVPVVAVSAFAGPREREQALEAGFDDTLAKPYDAAELIALLARAARRRRAA